MKGFCERTCRSKFSSTSSTGSPNRNPGSICSEPGPSDSKLPRCSFWPGFFLSAFSIFDTYSVPKECGKKSTSTRSHGWTAAVKRAMNGGSMRRIQERLLGFNRPGNSVSSSIIWLLGVCYKISQEDPFADPAHSDGFAAFVEDFSSRILMTYRKGFVSWIFVALDRFIWNNKLWNLIDDSQLPIKDFVMLFTGFATIGDSKYTSDVHWGCMLRSSQMLVAQALLCHRLGRSWRKTLDLPLDRDYVEILHLFGDSETSAFSIHNLLQAGKAYDLAPGSWVGPYAMCRTWETLVFCKNGEGKLADMPMPMAIYVVSGDEDGERGGAPVLCIEDVGRRCLEFSRGQSDCIPVLLLVPLVLGVEKINPRYIPLLRATFAFPQSLGILGGRPGVSTYIIGVQDDKAFYLDPHEVQLATDITGDHLEVDTSSYHSNVIRHIPLDSIDPSLAIGFYCRDKDDFDDVCIRASKLADQSNGSPLFTVTLTRNSPKPGRCHGTLNGSGVAHRDDSFDVVASGDNEGGSAQEDDWQLL